MTDKLQDISKQDLLDELASRLESGVISDAEVSALLQQSADTTDSMPTPAGPIARLPSLSIMRLLYVIGAIFITLGVLYLVSQIWDDLGTTGRIFITLGLGLLFAGTGSYFMLQDPTRGLGTVFHGIGGCIIPGGALVTLDEMGVDFDSTWPITLTIAMVFVFYSALTLVHRRVILTFWVFANGTALVYLLMDSLLPTASGEHYDYLTMTIGISYLICAHLFRSDWNERLTPLLNFFGAIGFYGAAFSQVPDRVVMEMLFPILAFGGLALSVAILQSRLVLVISNLAIIAYIIYFTAEYFADSIGWPVALILLGFIIIGIGYFSINLNRKYLKT
jgi:hypothetical protein